MEGCPKTLMITFDLKDPGPIENEFEAPLSQYIQDFYHEDPASYKNEIQQITNLRKNLNAIPRDVQGCRALRRYYTQLHYLQSRFPMEGGEASVPFIWYDVYNGDPVVYKDIRYEQACVLFNVGGLYSQLAANENRLSDESLKNACTQFQAAAGAFQFLKDNFNLSEFLDMTEDILQLKITVLLGQGLECILEKSILDNKNATLIARICVKIVEYFNEAVDLLSKNGTSEMGSSLRKSWSKHLKIKILSYEAISHVYMANDADQNGKYGVKVTYLKAASDKINEASKMLKNQADKVIERVNFIMDVVGNQYQDAVKNNDFIYHMAIPDISDMDALKPVNFVKPLPFQFDDKDIAGPDIFQRLVPMKAHEASSLYSEVKAKLLREISGEIETHDLKLSEYMSAMKVEDLLDPKEDTLPDDLLDKNKFLRSNPDLIPKVEKMVEELAMLSVELDGVLKNMKELLNQEQAFDTQENGGKVSTELTEFFNELKEFTDIHSHAQNTNMKLVQHLVDKKGKIMFLSNDPQTILQSLPSMNIVDGSTDEPVVQRLREILGKVDKMKTQRQTWLAQLRQEMNNDDVTAAVAVIKDKGNQETFFNEAIKKHDKIVGLLKQNLKAQENILQGLTEANAKYATTRQKELQAKERFDALVQEYLGDIKIFLGIQDKIRNGISFFKDLQGQIKQLNLKVSAYINERKKKRPQKAAQPSKPTPSRPVGRKPDIMRSTIAPQNVTVRPNIPPNLNNPSITSHQPGIPNQHLRFPSPMPNQQQQLHGPGQIANNQELMRPPLVNHAVNPRFPQNIQPQPQIQFQGQLRAMHPMQRPPQSPQGPPGQSSTQRFNAQSSFAQNVQRPPGPTGRFNQPNISNSIAITKPTSPQVINQRPQFPQRFNHPSSMPNNIPSTPSNMPNNISPTPSNIPNNIPSSPLHIPNNVIPPNQQIPGQHPLMSQQTPMPNHIQNKMMNSQQLNHGRPQSPNTITPRQQILPVGSQQQQQQQQQQINTQQQRHIRPPPPPHQLQQQVIRTSQPNGVFIQYPGIQNQQQQNAVRPSVPMQPVSLNQAAPRFQIPRQSGHQQFQQLPSQQPPLNRMGEPYNPGRFSGPPQQNFVSPVPMNEPVSANNSLPMPLIPEKAGSNSSNDSEVSAAPELSPVYPRSAEQINFPTSTSTNPQWQIQQQNQSLQSNINQPSSPHLPPQQQANYNTNRIAGIQPGLQIQKQYEQPPPQNTHVPQHQQQQLQQQRQLQNQHLQQWQPTSNNQQQFPQFRHQQPVLQPRPPQPQQSPMFSSSAPQNQSWTQQTTVQPRSQYLPQQNFQSPQNIPQSLVPAPFQSKDSLTNVGLSNVNNTGTDSTRLITPRSVNQIPAFNKQDLNLQPAVNPNLQQQQQQQYAPVSPGPSAPPISGQIRPETQVLNVNPNPGHGIQPAQQMYNPPLPYSGPTAPPQRPVVPSNSLLTGKPVMSPAHDPVVSNILGKSPVPTDINQINLQQFQLQQAMMLQQQQQMFNTLLQNQQTQRKAEEDSKITSLESEIASLKDMLKEKKEQDLMDDAEAMSKMQQMFMKMFKMQEQVNPLAPLPANSNPATPTGNNVTPGTVNQTPTTIPQTQPHNPLSEGKQERSESLVEPRTPSESPIEPRNNTMDDTEDAFINSSAPPSLSSIQSNASNASGPTSLEVIQPRTEEPKPPQQVNKPNADNEDNAPSSKFIALGAEETVKVEKPDSSIRVQPSGIDNRVNDTSELNIDTSHLSNIVRNLPNGNIGENVENQPFYEPKLDNKSNEHTMPENDDRRRSDPDYIVPRILDSSINALSSASLTNKSIESDPIVENVEAPSLPTDNGPPIVEDVILPRDVPVQVGATSSKTQQTVVDNKNQQETVSKDQKVVLISDNIPISDKATPKKTRPIISGKELSNSCRFSPINSPSMVKKMTQQKSLSNRSTPRSSPNVSARSSNRSSPILNANGQVVQLDDMDRKISEVIDHRHLARQLGRMSFYVGEPDEAQWRNYIQELTALAETFKGECKSLCKPLPNTKIDGFTKMWDDLAKQEQMDVKNYQSSVGEANVTKNRYRDILPWDHTRVKLNNLPNDYINATHVDNLTPLSPRYIATQGPIPQTFEDFWTMVWEQRTSVIVMLTNEIEGHKLKCHPYWGRGTDTQVEFGNMQLIQNDEMESSAWKVRTFTLLNKKEDDMREVRQYQFRSWPDYGTPETPYELLSFMEEVHIYHQSNDPNNSFPMVLHCSAGVGRTGSFCCIYSAIREMEGQNGLIDIPGVIRKLRQCRQHMVQRMEQMIFCFQAISCFSQQFINTERQKLANSRRPSLQSSTASSVFEDSFISPKFPTSNSKTNSPNLTISDHLKPTSTDTTELTKTLVIGTEKSSAFSSVAPKLDEKDKNDLITDNKNDINEDSKDSNPDPKSDSNNSTTPKFKIHSDIFQCHNNKAPNEQQEKIDPEKESNPS